MEHCVVSGDTIRANGWAESFDGQHAADAILLTATDTTGIERIIAITGDVRRPHQQTNSSKHNAWTLERNLPGTMDRAVVFVWVYDAEQRKAYRLATRIDH